MSEQNPLDQGQPDVLAVAEAPAPAAEASSQERLSRGGATGEPMEAPEGSKPARWLWKGEDVALRVGDTISAIVAKVMALVHRKQ